MNEKKVILVTGSSRGIGAELIKYFAKKEFKVVINYSKSDEEAHELYKEICSYTNEVLIIKADISVRCEVQTMFKQIIDKFGKVDVLINNASMNIDDSFINMTDEKWQKVLNINLTGTFMCCQEFAFNFKGEDGHIINVSAATAIKGRKNGVNYCSSKAGVISLTKCLALELAPSIKVNCILPGYMNTQEVMERYNLHDKVNYNNVINTIPLERIGTPEDICKVVNFIINESSYITGQDFFINGGQYMG